MTRPHETVAVAVLAALLAAGCGSDDGEPADVDAGGTTTPAQEGESRAPDVDDETLAWVGTMCTALNESGDAIGVPEIDPAHPESARDGFVSFLESIDAEFDALAETMEEVGAPPVTDGQDTFDAAMGTLESSQAAVRDAIASLVAAEVTDQESFEAAVSEAGETLEELDTKEGPTGDLRDNQALDTAFEEASECRNL
ncbi:hypothetical protein H0B56_08125 [Haloechinothrix sp. YIM 98757]|uniref:Uncharacterized protein n=1 Tax=Haloechinothrix aidingensis TaxID=2752311 RepID=A0A838A888_9PSEU|nr:hypothetical protein [Haloechinothrix aidingensis]MBA0125505.1 hypothetical protein [Haloechinothrix aidingensis]